MMKKLFSLILAVLLVVGMSVQGFAAIDLSNSYYDDVPYIVERTDEAIIFGTLDTVSLNEAQKNFMLDFFSVMTGVKPSKDYYYVFLRCDYDGVSVLSFVHSTAKCIPYILTQYGNEFGNIYCAEPDSYSFCSFKFSPQTLLYTLSMNKFETHQAYGKDINFSFNSNGYPISSISTSNDFYASALIWSNYSDPLSYESFTYGGKSYKSASQSGLDFICDVAIGFRDNDGLIDSVTPDTDDETPEAGGDSSESGGADEEAGDDGNDNSDDASSLPVGDDDNSSGGEVDFSSAYSGYDLAVWDSLSKTITPTLKKVAVVCLPLLACIYGIQLLLQIVPWLIFGYFRNTRGWYDKKTMSESHVYYHKKED